MTFFVSLLYWFFRSEVNTFLSVCNINIEVLFSGAFNIGSVFTGFLFTIYCFISVNSNLLIDKIKTTKTFQSVKKLLFKTTLVNLTSTVISLVMSSFGWGLSNLSDFQEYAIVGWFFIFTASLSYFIYCLHCFLIISNGLPQSKTKGG
jgi:hypothetical protein